MAQRLFKITASGAQHRRKEDGKFRVYGQGDTIRLSERAATHPAFAHLRLQLAVDTGRRRGPESDETRDLEHNAGSYRGEGHVDPATDPQGPQGSGEGSGSAGASDAPDDAGRSDQTDDAGQTDTDAPQDEISQLIAAGEASSGAVEFAAWRQTVVDSGILAEVPTKKQEVLAALAAARPTNGDE